MDHPEAMQKTIRRHASVAAAVGVPGAFLAHVDIPVLTWIWISLLIRISKLSGNKLEKATATKIVAGVLAGVGTLVGGVKLGTTLFAWTGVGTVPAVIVNSGANATVTYLFGRSVATIFNSDRHRDSVAQIVASVIALMLGIPPGDSGSV